MKGVYLEFCNNFLNKEDERNDKQADNWKKDLISKYNIFLYARM